MRAGSPNGAKAGSRDRLTARPLRWVAWGLFALGLLSALALTWLLRSGGGREFALARVAAALPAGALTWRTAEGTLVGPLVLRGVRYEHAGLVIEVERAVVDLAPTALVDGRLHIEQLTLDRGRVLLPPGDDTPAPWPREFTLPQALPVLQLPLDISLDALALREVQIRQGELALIVLHRLDAAGSFERGRLALDRLDLDSDRGTLRARGVLDSARHWDTGLHATLDLAGFGDTPLPLKIDAAGDLHNLHLAVVGDVPEPATLTLQLSGSLSDLRWRMALDAPRVDPRRFGSENDVFALALRGEGSLSAATLVGHVSQGARTLRIEPSTLRYDDGVVHLEPVALALDPGRVEVTGTLDLRPAETSMALDVLALGLQLAAADPADSVLAAGTARIEGPLADYVLTLDATLQRAQQTAKVVLRGRGSEHHVAFEQLDVAMPAGGLLASGEVAWSPEPRWSIDAKLSRFDPAWFVPGFPGAVDATLVSTGKWVDARPQGTLTLDPLGGTLRGRALGGRIVASLDAKGDGRGELALRLGDTRLDGAGSWDETVEANLRLNPLTLADVLPDAVGQLRGTLSLTGSPAAPMLGVELDGDAFAWQAVAARSLRLRARVAPAGHSTLSLEARTVELGGQRFDEFSISGEGTRERHALRLAMAGVPARLRLHVEGGERDGHWLGSLRDLRLEPAGHPAWTLRAPAALGFHRETGALSLGQSCLVAAAASLCAQADWGANRGEAVIRLDALPLNTLDPFLIAAFDAPASAWGVLSAEAHIARDRKGVLSGGLSADSTEGGLRLDPESQRELLAFRALTVQGSLDPQRAQLRADAQLADDGVLHAEFTFADPLADDGALQGRVDVRLRNLAFVELFVDQLADPIGAFDADFVIAGTRRAPTLAGSAQLRDFRGEWPALGLTLTDGKASLRSRGTTAADLEGSIASGAGTLRVAGRFDLAPAAEERLALTLRGENVVAAAIPELSASVSPDLELQVKGEQLRLRGKLTIPTARINLERLQSATVPSTDAVIVDAPAASVGRGTLLDSDVSVVLGEDVRLDGFGLKGELKGQIRVLDRPGRATIARGGLQVGGQYRAYGQDLTITRGRLAYASTPLDNPALDIRAEREIEEVTVGVQVRGTALAPELTLWSEPALAQAEQLAYLVLGRPLRSASQADGAQLTQAAAAFGGNLLAQKLGARLGLDEVGVADSRALGGAALTVGKFLSPRLYVSYGVALFDSGQVVTFKYLLNRIWSLQVDAGRENRAAINYRWGR